MNVLRIVQAPVAPMRSRAETAAPIASPAATSQQSETKSVSTNVATPVQQPTQAPALQKAKNWWNDAVSDARASHERLFGQHKQEVHKQTSGAPRKSHDVDVAAVIVDGSLDSPAHRAFLGARSMFLCLPLFTVGSLVEASAK